MAATAVRVERDHGFATYHPTGMRVGIIQSDPVQQIAVVLMREDERVEFIGNQPEPIYVEQAKLVLRPDHATDLVRILCKALNHLIERYPHQAQMYGLGPDSLRSAAVARFEGAADGDR